MRAIPDDNLAYPVLIVPKPKIKPGSGFFLNTASGTYLVTARHVLFEGVLMDELKAPEAELVTYPKDPKEAGRNVFTLDLEEMQSAGFVRRHETQDIAAVMVGKPLRGGRIEVLPGFGVANEAPSGFLSVGTSTLKLYDDVLVANEVFVFGYPTSLGLKAMPQLDLLRPLLRRGIVAGVNPDKRSIILDCPVYPGNSGGPVLEVELDDSGERRFSVIGVISQFVPYVETWVNARHGFENSSIENSGYSVATPMDFVLELVA